MVLFRKKMIVSLSLLIVQGLFSMDRQIEKVEEGVLGHYVSSETLGSFSTAAVNGWTMVTTSFAKATTTAINAYSDDAAFAKLGFPQTNDVNAAELLKFKAVSERYNQAILVSAHIHNEQFDRDDQFIDRRFEFLKRAINAMPIRGDGVELAIFCLEHYEKVMNSFMISRLVTFVQNKKEVSAQVAQVLNEKLSHLVKFTDNTVVLSVLNSSGSRRNSIEQEKPDGAEVAKEEQ